MKRLILMIVPALICGMVLTGCSDKAEGTSEDNILSGKWKLLLFTSFSTMEELVIPIDYTQKNIIYEFRANNVLMVSGAINNIDYRGHEIGKHSYEILPLPPSEPAGPCFVGHPIKINTETHFISFGWLCSGFYDGAAMFMSTQNGDLTLVRVD